MLQTTCVPHGPLITSVFPKELRPNWHMVQLVLFPRRAQTQGGWLTQQKAKIWEASWVHIPSHLPGCALRDSCLIMTTSVLKRPQSTSQEEACSIIAYFTDTEMEAKKQWNELLGIIQETRKTKYISWLSREAVNSRQSTEHIRFFHQSHYTSGN